MGLRHPVVNASLLFGCQDSRGAFGCQDSRGAFGCQDSRGAFGCQDSRGAFEDCLLENALHVISSSASYSSNLQHPILWGGCD